MTFQHPTMLTSLEIKAPSRLHLGLFGWGPEAEMQFGGFGLMIQQPELHLQVSVSDNDQFDVPEDQKAKYESLLNSCREYLLQRKVEIPRLHFRLNAFPPMHHGLGSGTQRAMAVAAAVSKICGIEMKSAADLATMANRFPRSGVGIHGFLHGGLIIDGGHSEGLGGHRQIAPLKARIAWPDDWQILLVIPDEPEGISSQAEQNVFHDLPTPDRPSMTDVKYAVFDRLTVAMEKSEFELAMKAIETVQAIVGRWFAPGQQGSVYGSPRRDRLIRAMKQAGLKGVGQSSWGPALFGFCRAGEMDSIEARFKQQSEGESNAIRMIRTVARNQPTLT
ncbi:MAG: hypothetical protein ACKO0V_13720 [bacterium]